MKTGANGRDAQPGLEGTVAPPQKKRHIVLPLDAFKDEVIVHAVLHKVEKYLDLKNPEIRKAYDIVDSQVDGPLQGQDFLPNAADLFGRLPDDSKQRIYSHYKVVSHNQPKSSS